MRVMQTLRKRQRERRRARERSSSSGSLDHTTLPGILEFNLRVFVRMLRCLSHARQEMNNPVPKRHFK